MTTKTTAVARVRSNAGRGHGGNGGGDVVAPSGAGQQRATRGRSRGVQRGVHVDYYLQVCPLIPLNPL